MYDRIVHITLVTTTPLCPSSLRSALTGNNAEAIAVKERMASQGFS